MMSAETRRRQRGMTLIEVLTSMLILGVGVLGMIAVQTNATRFLQSSHLQGEAALLASDLADRMLANRDSAIGSNAYVHSYPASSSDNESSGGAGEAADCTAQNCNEGQLAAYDLAEWQARLTATLPTGNSRITRTATAGVGGSVTNDFLIVLNWDERGDRELTEEALDCNPETLTANSFECYQLEVSL